MHHTTVPPVHERIYEPIVSALEEVLTQLPLTACPALVGELERLKMLAMVRMLAERVSTTTHVHDLLTIPEIAKRLKVSKYRAYELARQGLLKTIRLGRLVRVKPSDVDSYMVRQGH